MQAVKTLGSDLLAGLKPGLWAAISQDQDHLVSTGRTLKEVLRKAEKKGEKRPFIIRVSRSLLGSVSVDEQLHQLAREISRP